MISIYISANEEERKKGKETFFFFPFSFGGVGGEDIVTSKDACMYVCRFVICTYIQTYSSGVLFTCSYQDVLLTRAHVAFSRPQLFLLF